MNTLLPAILIMMLIGMGCGKKSGDSERQKTKTKTAHQTKRWMGTIEQFDNELSRVLDVKSKPEVIAEGFDWSEGPVWVEEYGYLLFSDIPTNTIFKWKEGEAVSRYLKPSGYTGAEERSGELGSNGLAIDSRGRLLLCQHGDRRIARMGAPLVEPAADFITLAGSYEGKKLNSPNDLAQHSNGDIYFTDPPYGLEGGANSPNKELRFQGVYRLNVDADYNGEPILLTDELSRPNGIALSPDEKTLYVANSDPDNPIWMAYEVSGDGGIAGGHVFHDASEVAGKEKGLPDGMKVDTDGYIYATGPGGVWIFAPDGRLLGKIKTGQATSNCAIGNDGKMLYMTADNYLLRVPLK